MNLDISIYDLETGTFGKGKDLAPRLRSISNDCIAVSPPHQHQIVESWMKFFLRLTIPRKFSENRLAHFRA
jgi:hypothetical protein